MHGYQQSILLLTLNKRRCKETLNNDVINPNTSFSCNPAKSAKLHLYGALPVILDAHLAKESVMAHITYCIRKEPMILQPKKNMTKIQNI